jgi:putative hemolysin
MSFSASLRELFESSTHNDARHRLQVSLAAGRGEIRESQRLRHQVFVEEMGARVDCAEEGIEADRFDPYCQHLIVRDLNADRVVGSYRLLEDRDAIRAGGFYSQSEFEMSRILALPGRIMEVGRTCVHPDYRSGATIALLWQGLARYLVINRIDYLIGCASIPLRHGTDEALAIYRRLSDRHLAPAHCRVYPRQSLPRVNLAGAQPEVTIPPLIKGYLRAGAKIGGEPAWDPQFNVADLFILLRTDSISERYSRHFIHRA